MGRIFIGLEKAAKDVQSGRGGEKNRDAKVSRGRERHGHPLCRGWVFVFKINIKI